MKYKPLFKPVNLFNPIQSINKIHKTITKFFKFFDAKSNIKTIVKANHIHVVRSFFLAIAITITMTILFGELSWAEKSTGNSTKNTTENSNAEDAPNNNLRDAHSNNTHNNPNSEKALTPTETEIVSKAKQAIIVAMNEDGSVVEVFSHNKNQKCSPASMTKIMTCYVVFDELKKGNITLDKKITIREEAWRQKGSRMFLQLGSEVSINDLIIGIIVPSGNDASIALIEGVFGSIGTGVNVMNQKAQELEMYDTHFVEPSGIQSYKEFDKEPENEDTENEEIEKSTALNNGHSLKNSHSKGNFSTVLDIAKLSVAIFQQFPEYYNVFSIQSFSHNGITQYNRNPVISMGADGLKTGFLTSYSLSFSFLNRNSNIRFFAVINGCESEKSRKECAKIIMNYCLINIVKEDIFPERTPLFTINSKHGKQLLQCGLKEKASVLVNKEKTKNAYYKFAHKYYKADYEKDAKSEKVQKSGKVARSQNSANSQCKVGKIMEIKNIADIANHMSSIYENPDRIHNNIHNDTSSNTNKTIFILNKNGVYYKIQIVIDNDVQAPIKTGDVIGQITISTEDDRTNKTLEIISLNNVEKSNFMSILLNKIIGKAKSLMKA